MDFRSVKTKNPRLEIIRDSVKKEGFYTKTGEGQSQRISTANCSNP